MAWAVFTEAPNQTVAESWRGYLNDCGVPCRVYPGDVSSFLGVSVRSVRLMTQPDFMEQAQQLVAELRTAQPSGDSDAPLA